MLISHDNYFTCINLANYYFIIQYLTNYYQLTSCQYGEGGGGGVENVRVVIISDPLAEEVVALLEGLPGLCLLVAGLTSGLMRLETKLGNKKGTLIFNVMRFSALFIKKTLPWKILPWPHMNILKRFCKIF